MRVDAVGDLLRLCPRLAVAPPGESTSEFGVKPPFAEPVPSSAAFASTAAPTPGTWRSVDMIAPLTWFGFMPGFAWITRAATPETTALDIEVPLSRK